MDLVGAIKEAGSEWLEAQRFIRKHRLIPDPKVSRKYYLTAARDTCLEDVDLRDPEVRAKVEKVILEHRANVVIRRERRGKKGEKEEKAEEPDIFGGRELKRRMGTGDRWRL